MEKRRHRTPEDVTYWTKKQHAEDTENGITILAIRNLLVSAVEPVAKFKEQSKIPNPTRTCRRTLIDLLMFADTERLRAPGILLFSDLATY